MPGAAAQPHLPCQCLAQNCGPALGSCDTYHSAWWGIGLQPQAWQLQGGQAVTSLRARPSARTSGWLKPKYSGPAIAVLGAGGRSSPARRRASISPLMRFSTCHAGSDAQITQHVLALAASAWCILHTPGGGVLRVAASVTAIRV